METITQRQKPSNVSVKFIAAKDVFVIKDTGGRGVLVNANLIRHALQIPYTKKNGVKVSKKEIEASHEKSRLAYARAITEYRNAF